MKKCGEWLLGALAASCPGGVTPTKKKNPGNALRVVREVLGAGDIGYRDDLGVPDHAFQQRHHSRGQPLVVHHHRIVVGGNFDFCRGAGRGGDVPCRAADGIDDHLPGFRRVGPEGTDHLHFVGDDVVADAALYRADRQHGGITRDVELPADDGLHAEHDLRRGHDRVHPAPGSRTVRLAPLDENTVAVRGRHHRPRAITDLARVQLRPQVQPEYRLGPDLLEDPLLEHQRGTATLAVRRPLLGRLENEQHRSRQVLPDTGQRFRDAHQDRHVAVVAAGVHHADLLATIFRRRGRLERQLRLLGHRQRIHVRPQRDHGPGAAPAQHADHAGMGDPGRHLHAQRLEVSGDLACRPELSIAEFRVLMKIPPPGEHLRGDLVRLALDLLQIDVSGGRQRCERRCGQRDGIQLHGSSRWIQ